METTNALTEFFSAVWGDSPGMRIVCAPRGAAFVSTAYETNDAAIKAMQAAIWDGLDCYFGVHLFKGEDRKAKSAIGCRALYLDIDTGKAGCYESQEKALKAVWEFSEKTGLPLPTLLDSGNGLHCYYLLDSLLSEDVWSDAARQLKTLCKMQGLKADVSVTTDAARVLRCPDSRNYKDAGNPKAVRILTPLNTVRFDTLQSTLRDAAPFEIPTIDTSIKDVFLGDIKPQSDDAKAIARLCMPFLGAERCDEYSEWLNVGIVLNNVFSGDPEGLELWEKWSALSAKYKPGVCAQKWDGFGERSDGEKLSVGSLVCWAKFDNAEAFESVWETFRVERLSKMRLTDAGNAERLIALYGDCIRYDDTRKLWSAWNGSFWCEGAESDVIQYALSTVRTMYKEAGKSDDDNYRQALAKHATKSESAASLKAMVEVAKTNPAIRCTVADFDSHPHLLNVKNGVIDLRTGKLLPPNRDLMFSNCVPFEYDPNAMCPIIWDGFLNRIFSGSADTVGFVQRAIGYSLTGETSEQVYFLCYGTGQNGKSKLLEAVGGLLGKLAGTLRTEAIMDHKFTSNSGHNADVANLLGKRFVVASETERVHSLAEATIKKLTGGDVISASRKYGQPFDFTPTSTLWIMANYRPSIQGTDEGTWRRIRVIPFDVTIPASERDNDLSEKLRSEYAGILAWAVRGSVEWYARGLGSCHAVSAATSAYRYEQDSVSRFVAEYCETGTGSGFTVSPTQLRSTYEGWCTDNGIDAVSPLQFAAEIRKLDFKQGKANHARVWKGLRVKPLSFDVLSSFAEVH